MNDLKQQLSLSIRARYPLIYLVTSEENRAEEALEEVGRTIGKEVVTWTCSRGFQPPQGDAKKSTQPEEALKYIDASDKKAVFVLKDFHPYLEEPKILRRMRDLVHHLKRSYKTILLVSPVLKIPPELEKDITVHDLPLPDAGELAEVLNNLLEPYRKSQKVKVELTQDLQEKVIQATLGLTRNEAENVYAKALITDRKFSKDDLPQIIDEKKQLIRKSGILDFIGLSITLANVGGLGKLKEWLKERGGAFSNKAREYGLPEPKGLLMLGVQGCGKSLCAKAVARAWDMPLLRFDVGRMFSSLVGSSEENVRRAIAVAESIAPVVLWVDEIDKAFSGSQGSANTDGGTTARVMSTFLTWLSEKQKPVFVLATANNISRLPPELLRKGRLDEIFFVDLPSAAERERIFAIHIAKRKRKPDRFELPQLAEAAEGFSGAEIEEAVVSGLYEAFYLNRDVTSDDLIAAVRVTVPLSKTMAEEEIGRAHV